MDHQLATYEVEYWMELESLLARFHQDLDRVRAALAALGDDEIADSLSSAQWHVGVACCAAASRHGCP